MSDLSVSTLPTPETFRLIRASASKADQLDWLRAYATICHIDACAFLLWLESEAR